VTTEGLSGQDPACIGEKTHSLVSLT